MLYPYDKFIIYRLLRGDRKDDVDRWMAKYCLPLTKDEDLKFFKDKIKNLGLPVGYKTILAKNCLDDIPRNVLDFLRFHKLDKIFLYEIKRTSLKEEEVKAMDGAFNIHEVPFTRMAINVLLIHRQSSEAISDLISIGHCYNVSANSIDIYKDLFFNVNGMTKDSWKNLLSGLDYREKEIIFAALTNKLEDIKYLIKVPTNIEYTAFLKRALETANYKMNYYASLNTDQGDKMARSWAFAGIFAGEKFAKYSRGDASDFVKSLQLEFESVDQQIDMLSPELAADILPAAKDIKATSQQDNPQPPQPVQPPPQDQDEF